MCYDWRCHSSVYMCGSPTTFFFTPPASHAHLLKTPAPCLNVNLISSHISTLGMLQRQTVTWWAPLSLKKKSVLVEGCFFGWMHQGNVSECSAIPHAWFYGAHFRTDIPLPTLSVSDLPARSLILRPTPVHTLPSSWIVNFVWGICWFQTCFCKDQGKGTFLVIHTICTVHLQIGLTKKSCCYDVLHTDEIRLR